MPQEPIPQSPAAMPNAAARGVSPVSGAIVLTPMPTPSRLSPNCGPGALATPPQPAPRNGAYGGDVVYGWPYGDVYRLSDLVVYWSSYFCFYRSSYFRHTSILL